MPANPVFHILRAKYVNGYELEENQEVDLILFEEVREINDSLVLPDEEGPILRYQPLHDGSHFLFSVIYPQKPNANHDRVHHVAVHFLMNDEAAVYFFSHNFTSTATAAILLAESVLSSNSYDASTLSSFFRNPEAPAFQTAGKKVAPEHGAMLLQAADSCLRIKSSSFNIYSANSAMQILADLIGLVPPLLRHKLSFQSRFPHDGDDQNISIRFLDREDNLPEINPSMYHLFYVPQKIELYEHIQYLIDSWIKFQELGNLVNSGKTSLRQVLKKFRKTDIHDYIEAPNFDFSGTEKARLLKAIKKIPPIPNLFSRHRDQPRTPPAAAPAVRTRPANRSRGSLPLLLLLLAVFVMSTALVLIGASRWWSVLSIFTGPAFGGYLVWNWKPHRR